MKGAGPDRRGRGSKMGAEMWKKGQGQGKGGGGREKGWGYA